MEREGEEGQKKWKIEMPQLKKRGNVFVCVCVRERERERARVQRNLGERKDGCCNGMRERV